MRRKHCACHETVQPRQTNSCKSTRNFGDIKFAALPLIQRPSPQTSISQSPKSLRLPRKKPCFKSSSNPPRLPTFLQPSRTPALPRTLHRVEIIALTKRKSFWTSKTAPSTSYFNDFHFRPALAILASQSLSRHSVVQILASWAAHPPHPPVFRS